jgi:hypothetical protein
MDGFVKSCTVSVNVIPAKAGIQLYQPVLAHRLRGRVESRTFTKRVRLVFARNLRFEPPDSS